MLGAQARLKVPGGVCGWGQQAQRPREPGRCRVSVGSRVPTTWLGWDREGGMSSDGLCSAPSDVLKPRESSLMNVHSSAC